MATLHLPQSVRACIGRIARSLRPQSIVLFGSYAKGRATGNSDVDLLIVMPAGEESESLLQQCRQLVDGSFPRIDPVVCTAAELADDGPRALFLQSAFASGTLLFDGSRQSAVSVNPPPRLTGAAGSMRH